MINTDKLNQLIGVDRENMTITVQAGMKLVKVNQILQEHQLAMSNLGSISDQSVAGLMATATHGSGAEYSTLCASVNLRKGRIARVEEGSSYAKKTIHSSFEANNLFAWGWGGGNTLFSKIGARLDIDHC